MFFDRAVQIFYELFETYTVRLTSNIRIYSCYADYFIFIQSRGVSVFITHLRAGPREMFERGGIVKLLGEDAFYEDVGTAINHLARDATLLRY